MIKIIYVIVMVTGTDSSSSLPQTRYSTKAACMEAVNGLLIGDWRYNKNSYQIEQTTTPSKYIYATCIPSEEVSK